MADKTIKISFVVDTVSFNKVISQINQLAQATQKAMSGVSNVTGGGIFSGSVKTISHTGPSSYKNPQITNQAQSVGIPQQISQQIQAQQNLLKSLGDTSSKVWSMMAQSSSNSTRSMMKDLDAFENKIESVSSALKGLGSSGGGVGGLGGGGFGGGLGGAPGAGGAYGPQRGPSFDLSGSQEVKNYSSTRAMFLGATAISLGGYAFDQYANGAYEKYYRDAKFGAPFADRASKQLNFGADSLPWHFANMDVRKDFSSHVNTIENKKAKRWAAASEKGGAAGAWEKAKVVFDDMSDVVEYGGLRQQIGVYGSKIIKGTTGLFGTNTTKLGLAAGMAAAAPGLMESFKTGTQEQTLHDLGLTEQRLANHRLEYEGAAKLSGQFDRYTGLEHALRIGGRNKQGVHAMMLHEANLEKGGFTPEEELAAQNALVTSAGYAGALKNRNTMMRASRGGYALAPFIGAAAQTGQDVDKLSKLMAGAFNSGKGKGDEYGGSVIGNAIAQSVLSGGTTIDMQSLLAAASGGTKASPWNNSTMWNATSYAEGRKYLNEQVYGGGKDQLQQALNQKNMLAAWAGNEDAFGMSMLFANNKDVGSMVTMARGVNDAESLKRFGKHIDPTFLEAAGGAEQAKNILLKYGELSEAGQRNFLSWKAGGEVTGNKSWDNFQRLKEKHGTSDVAEILKKEGNLSEEQRTEIIKGAIHWNRMDRTVQSLQVATGIVQNELGDAFPIEKLGGFINVQGEYEKGVHKEKSKKMATDAVGAGRATGATAASMAAEGKDINDAAVAGGDVDVAKFNKALNTSADIANKLAGNFAALNKELEAFQKLNKMDPGKAGTWLGLGAILGAGNVKRK